MTTLYFVNFEGTAAEGKGDVVEASHKQWFKMDDVGGCQVSQEIGGSEVGYVDNNTRNPISISALTMSVAHSSVAPYLHQIKINNDVIKKITVHRMRNDNKQFVVDEEVIIENARISEFYNENDMTAASFGGFSTFEKSYYSTTPDGNKTPMRVGYDLAAATAKA